MTKLSIGIIGGGNMGEALIKGLKDERVCVSEANSARASFLKKKYKVKTGAISDVIENAKVVILAVKPQDMESALKEIGDGPRLKDKLFISIAAGLTTKFFEKHLGQKVRMIRTMPNMPALIAEGITAIAGGKYATVSDLKLAQKLLSSIGKTILVKESQIDAVTAVSGSGPAYVFLFVEQWIAAAKDLGLNETQAGALVYQTLIGSAHLLEKSTFDAGTLRAKVTSKGGTTQAALDVFSKAKFDQLVKKALAAADKRAKELAK
jgi:pyrroline-5-carboxylate reductase